MTSTDVATRTPAAMVAQYSGDFAAVLPSHIRPETWVRLAQGALRRDKSLLQAATQNPGSLMTALLEAARLGLEPGTHEYYLTPRFGRDPGVLGIVGYRGEIELIYRAGAVSSVVVETVHAGDRFEYVPGVHDKPVHHVDWFGDRGDVLGAYAYAVMHDGAISKVVVIGPAEIKRAMAASATASKSHSPWQTDYPAMVRKTAVHQLAKYVPTSAEYRREQLRAAASVDQAVEHVPVALPPVEAVVDADDVDYEVDVDTGEIVEVES